MSRFFLLCLICILSSSFTYAQKGANFLDYISFYQNNISEVRDGKCQMYPSCSYYGVSAFKNYNPITAMTMVSDRVLRCSHDYTFYDIALTKKGYRLIDLAVPNIKKELSLKSSTKIKRAFPLGSVDDDCDLDFINYLMIQESYSEALLEINRRMFYKKGNCSSLYVNFIRCKIALNEMEGAIFQYNTFFPEAIKTHPIVQREIGNCFFELGNFQSAAKYYQLTLSNEGSDQYKDRALLGIAYIYTGQLEQARKEWELIPASHAQLYPRSQEALRLLRKRPHLKRKKAFVAGALSVVPGLGYLYTGHKTSAISSFIVNGLLGYALYTSIKKENYGMASLVGVFSFSFYLGNITGATKSAKRYNTAQINQQNARMKSLLY